MKKPLTIEDLRDEPIERLVRDVEARLAAVLGPHRLGDPWPEITVLDWCLLAGLLLRTVERQEDRRP